MTSFSEHFQAFSIPVLVALFLLTIVVAIAVWRNYRVKAGLRVGWFSFSLETDRDEPHKEPGIEPEA